MMEVKRICTKRFVLIVIACLIINVLALCRDYLSENNLIYGTFYQENITRLNEMPRDEIQEYIENEQNKIYGETSELLENDIVDNQSVMKVLVLEDLSEQSEYVQDYENRYDNMVNSVSRVALLNGNNYKESFAYKNLKKSLNDYYYVKDIKLTFENDNAVSRILKFDLTQYIVIMLVLTVVLSFFDEQKKGLFQIVRCTYRKDRLALKRGFIIVGFSFLFTLIFYCVNYLILGNIFGFPDLSKQIQNYMSFSNAYQDLKLWQVLAILIVLKSIAISIIGYMAWIILNLIRSQMLAMMLLIGVTGIQLVVYQNADNLFLKNINIFRFLNIKSLFTRYENISFADDVINVGSLSVICLAIMFVILFILAIIVAKRKRMSNKSHTSALSFLSKLCPSYHNTNIWYNEAKRFFIVLGALPLIIIAVLFSYYRYSGEEVHYSDIQQMIIKHYDNIEGEYTDEVWKYIDNEKEAIEKEWDELTNMINANPELETNQVYQSRKEYLEKRQEAYDYIEKEAERLQKDKENGYDVAFVKPFGYDKVLDFGVNDEGWNIAVGVLFIILAVSGVFAYDNQYGMNRLTNTFAHSYRKIRNIRLSYVLLLNFCYILVMFFLQKNMLRDVYEIENQNYGIRSVVQFENCEWGLTVGNAMVLLWLFRLVVIECISIIFIYISEKAKNIRIASGINIAIIGVPLILACMQVSGSEFISFYNVLINNDIYLNIINGNMGWLTVYILILLFAVLLWGNVFSILPNKFAEGKWRRNEAGN